MHPSYSARGPHLFVDDVDHPYSTSAHLPFYWIRGRQVGGRSLVWGGTALRLSPNELRPSLDGVDLPRWPLTYADLAPWYSLVEREMGVLGTRENLDQLPDGVYDSPVYQLTPAELQFHEAYRSGGTHPIHVRYVSPSERHDQWPGYTMQGTALASALATGRARVLSDAYVYEIRVDDSTGEATGVSYIDTTTGTRRQVSSRVVFVCGGTIETTRLMLNSTSRRHPHGLGNSSGWLGRGLMDHPVVSAAGRLPAHEVVQGYDWSARQRGLTIPPAIESDARVRPFGLWLTLQRSVDGPFAAGNIDAQGEMLPYWENRVAVSDVPDRWGVRTVHIECGYHAHEAKLYREMRRRLFEVAEVVGMELTSLSAQLSAPGLNAHEMGTARMGDDPSSSVVDRFNSCWDCPNVYVTDGASFPTGGWQNPTLTIMAISARAAARTADRLLSREGG